MIVGFLPLPVDPIPMAMTRSLRSTGTMGMPFQMSIVPFPLEFIITAKTTFILFEVMTSEPRRIYTDGRDFPQDHPPTYPGYSIGKWLDTASAKIALPCGVCEYQSVKRKT